eukprot:10861074-Heterocapsa_arctica.AAC.1
MESGSIYALLPDGAPHNKWRPVCTDPCSNGPIETYFKSRQLTPYRLRDWLSQSKDRCQTIAVHGRSDVRC